MVVTALGIEREERALTYSVQTVSAEALERTPEVNLVQALHAQSAGISRTVRRSARGIFVHPDPWTVDIHGVEPTASSSWMASP